MRRISFGFTFIEVVLAIALIGAVLTPLFMVQNNVLRLVFTSSDRLQRVFMLQNVCYESALKLYPKAEPKRLSSKITLDDPATSVNFTVTPLQVRSSLNSAPLKHFPDLYLLRAHGTWQRFLRTYDDTVIGILYHPEQKKDAA